MKKDGCMGRNTMFLSAFLFLFVLGVFGIGLRYVGSGDLVPNELLPVAIIQGQSFYFDDFVTDKDAVPYYYVTVKGRIVSAYWVIPGLLNLPVFFVAHVFGVDLLKNVRLLSLLSSLLISSASVVFMFLCLTKVCRRQSTAVFFSLVYAFATCVWSVACRGIWQHGPSLLFITSALFLLFCKKGNLLLYAGFFFGMAVFNRPTNAMLVLPMTLYVFKHRREKFKWYLACLVVPIALLCWYSWAYLGNVFLLGQGQRFRVTDDFWLGLAGLLISPNRGLFVFSPVLIFSVFYLIWLTIKKDAEPVYRYMAAAVILLIGVCALWASWWGGHCFGYRLLIETIPMLIIFVSLCWEDFIADRIFLKAIFYGLLFFSVYFNFLGAFLYSGEFNNRPNDIDSNVERLWDIKNGELARDSLKLLRLVSEVFQREK